MEQSKSNEIVLDIDLDENDAYKFNLRQSYKSSGVKSAFVVAAIGLAYFISLFGRTITKGNRMPVQSYFFLIIIAGLVYLPVYIRRSIHKAVIVSNFSQGTMHCSFSDKQIRVRLDTSHIELSWNKVFGVLEVRDYFAVYTSKSKMLLIPKRFFKKSEDISTFRNLVMQSLPKDKYMLRAVLQSV